MWIWFSIIIHFVIHTLRSKLRAVAGPAFAGFLAIERNPRAPVHQPTSLVFTLEIRKCVWGHWWLGLWAVGGFK